MAHKKHIPKKAANRGNIKEVRTKEHYVDAKPVWRFSTVDKEGAFCWPKGKNEELEIVGKLHDFDSMTWADIQGKQHHYLSARSLSREAVKRLEHIKLDDEVDNLFSFRLQGKPRIIAIKHASIAKLLWYDPEHLVAPSAKKHT